MTRRWYWSGSASSWRAGITAAPDMFDESNIAAEATMTDLVLGLDTFGDVPVDDSGAPVSQAAAIRQAIDAAVAAGGLGVDVIALGEHHRPEYSISTPETVLAAIGARTRRIRLASGVTVLSSDDPVRVFQRFATVDAIS